MTKDIVPVKEAETGIPEEELWRSESCSCSSYQDVSCDIKQNEMEE